MHPLLGEFIGSMLLILLGDGVVANVVLNKTKGQNGGWIVIAFGWAMAVFIGVIASTKMGAPGHINPAVSIAMAYMGKLEWSNLAPIVAVQLGGTFTGAVLVWISYRQHFGHTPDGDSKLAVFCTGPAIRHSLNNLLTEIIGTFVLLLSALLMSKPEVKLGSLDALPVALLVLAIGLSLGGPTGYAINPSRDLGPRIAHFILPIPQKRNSDWSYAWIPIAGPIIGGLLAAAVFELL